MNLPAEWLRAELLAEIALAALLVEGLVLTVLRRRTGRGLPPRVLLGMLLPGGLLLLALRAAMVGAGGPSIAALLTAALLAHLADLRQRHETPPRTLRQAPRGGD